MGSFTLLSAWLLTAMIADPVVVSVQPLDDRAAFAIIDACNRALGEPRCALSSSSNAAPQSIAPGAPPPIARVRIALSGPELERAAVAFEAGGVLSPARILEFEDSDPLEERYRAIGLVIAARLFEEAAALKERPPPTVPATPPPEPELKRFGFETALFLGEGLDRGDMRWGLRSRALAQPFASLPVSAVFAVRLGTASAQDDQLTMRWTSFALGLQGHVPLIRDALRIELHAEGALQLVHAAIEDRATGRTDEGDETRSGGIFGAQLAWMPFSFWALFIGAESSLLWPTLILEVRRAEVAKEDPLRFSAHIGQRLVF